MINQSLQPNALLTIKYKLWNLSCIHNSAVPSNIKPNSKHELNKHTKPVCSETLLATGFMCHELPEA